MTTGDYTIIDWKTTNYHNRPRNPYYGVEVIWGDGYVTIQDKKEREWDDEENET